MLWGWDSVAATSALGDEKEGEGSRFRACSVTARLEAGQAHVAFSAHAWVNMKVRRCHIAVERCSRKK